MRRLFWLPFNFTSVLAGASDSDEPTLAAEKEFFALGLVSTNTGFTFELFDYSGNLRLSDEPIQSGTFSADCQNAFYFPSPLRITPNTRMVGRVVNFSNSTRSLQISLFGYLQDGAPPPDRRPFLLSFNSLLGFGDPLDTGLLTVQYNQNTYGIGAKPPLQNDFEMVAVTFGGENTTPYFSLQLADRKTKQTLFASPSFMPNAAGGFAGDIFTVALPANPTDFPTGNVLQHRLTKPVLIKRGSQLQAIVEQSPMYLSSNAIHSSMNGNVNFVVIGNKLL